jgi:hypothetical protein
MLRNLFALLSGAFATMIVITFLAIANARLVYPPPAGIDFNQAAQANAFIAGMPLAALLLLALSWPLGAFAGGWVVGKLADRHRAALAVLLGLLVSAGVVQSAMTVVHPTWVVAVGVGVPPVLAWLAARLAQGRAATQNGLASTR